MLHEGKIRDKPGITLYFTVLFSGVGTPISPLFTQKSPPPYSHHRHRHYTCTTFTHRMAGSWAGKGAAGRIERLFYGGSWRLVRWRCSVQLRGRLAALREVAPCLNARRVQALRWQLLPRVQSLRLMALRCCCCCLDVGDSIAGFTKCDRSVTIPFSAVRGWEIGIASPSPCPHPVHALHNLAR